MTTTLNILHLLMLLAALGCVCFALREMKGAPLSRRHLIALPLLAVPVALTLLIFQQASHHQPPWLWGALGLVGLLAGAIRGTALRLGVDHTWDLAILPRSRQALGVALVLMATVGFEGAAVLAAGDGATYRIVATAGAVLCAGLITGRALAILLRFSHSPQVYLRSC